MHRKETRAPEPAFLGLDDVTSGPRSSWRGVAGKLLQALWLWGAAVTSGPGPCQVWGHHTTGIILVWALGAEVAVLIKWHVSCEPGPGTFPHTRAHHSGPLRSLSQEPSAVWSALALPVPQLSSSFSLGVGSEGLEESLPGYNLGEA